MPVSNFGIRVQWLLRTGLVVMLVGLAACASKGPQNADELDSMSPKARSAMEEKVQSRVKEVEQLAGKSAASKEDPAIIGAYRKIAADYPMSKEPLQRLGQYYFDKKNYGQAILVAEEVRAIDQQDRLAASLLTVSGLRSSTIGLSTLRERNGIPSEARHEAERLTNTLRQVLGESVLVPRAISSENETIILSGGNAAKLSTTNSNSSTVSSPKRNPVRRAAPAPVRRTVPAARLAAPAKPAAGGSSPFDRLD